jgi:hypothetical protein
VKVILTVGGLPRLQTTAFQPGNRPSVLAGLVKPAPKKIHTPRLYIPEKSYFFYMGKLILSVPVQAGGIRKH